jgi:EAL domain-containing protein (putative c-di-GMP-specific phosphodiesterase class I)
MKPDFDLEGHTLHVSSSIGIAVYPGDGQDAETLLKNADAALYRAKDSGRNGYHLYTSAINSETSEWLALESQLHRALERQEFVIYYQPQVNVITGEITQMEALLRWQHPEKGLLLPGKFVPLAEENGLVVPIGEWVLRTVCTQNQTWQTNGLPPVRVAVNLSAQQLRQPNLVQMIARVLCDTGLAPAYLELEITETTVMKNVELTKTILCELYQMGVSMAMDDFGTGYSSLGYLKNFPFNTLKIDQSFVRDLTTDPNDKAIVAAIVAMGRVLNLKLVAEGVETKVQKHSLLSLDCEEMQGNLFSPPLTAEEATLLLETQFLRFQDHQQ